jgi:hypothetical protein
LQGNCATGGVLNVEDALGNTFLGPQITMVSAVPSEMDPNVSYEVKVTIDPREDTLNGDVSLYYKSAESDNFMAMPMNMTGLMEWSGTLPGMGCDDEPEFYISCEGQVSGTVEHPSGGATNAYGWMIGTSIVSYDDNGESDGAWTVSSTALDGQWNRGVPINCDRGDPSSDYDGSGSCWLTDNSSGDGCNSDVDEGYTTLTSGVIDLSQVNSPILSYARWFHNSYGAAPNTDTFVVEWSSNGSAWYELESVGPSGSEVNGGWVHVSFSVNDFAGDISQVQLRFTASDEGADTQSVVEAGVDAIMVSAVDCDDVNQCPADANGDGVVSVDDLLSVIADWGLSNSPADVDANGVVNVEDLLLMIAAWGACP